jgi:hypothetical protein
MILELLNIKRNIDIKNLLDHDVIEAAKRIINSNKKIKKLLKIEKKKNG